MFNFYYYTVPFFYVNIRNFSYIDIGIYIFNLFNFKFSALELPKPQPYRCPCLNGGQCEEDSSSNRVICRCSENYSGMHCREYNPQTNAHSSVQKGGKYLLFS